MTPREAARLCADAADRLQESHDRGILHRDLRPSDLRLDARGRVTVDGFGREVPEDDVRPRHRSPEQLFSSPEEVDARADVYSLGSVLYELLTGRAPFDDPDPCRALKRLEIEDPAPPGVSKALDDALLRALAKEPTARFATAREFAVALRAATPRPRAWLLPAAAAALVVLVLASRPTPPAHPPRPTAPADPRVPWLADRPSDPPDLFPAARDLALLAAVETDPARLSGEILARVGPMMPANPASPGPYALMGVAHLLHANRALAREYFARARARLDPGADLDRDPLGRLLAGKDE